MTTNTARFFAVKENMSNEERNRIASTWDDLALRERLKTNPYSLTQAELERLQIYARLGAKLECLLKDFFVMKALNKSFKYKI